MNQGGFPVDFLASIRGSVIERASTTLALPPEVLVRPQLQLAGPWPKAAQQLTSVQEYMLSRPVVVPRTVSKERLCSCISKAFWWHFDSLQGSMKRTHQTIRCGICNRSGTSKLAYWSVHRQVVIYVVDTINRLNAGGNLTDKPPPDCNHIRLIRPRTPSEIRLIAYLGPDADPAAIQMILDELTGTLKDGLALLG